MMLLFSEMVDAQNKKVIDALAAVVGSHMVLQSEIEVQHAQYIAQGNKPDESLDCRILEQIMFNKLLLHQANLDSIKISDAQIDSELERRIRYFIQQIGSQEKLEEFYKKSIVEIKSEFREMIKDQLLTQNMQSKITKDITASPSDVRDYYSKIPSDSLPLINSEMEIGQIVLRPLMSKDSKNIAREKLEAYRKRILEGEMEFAALAALYSEDPGSSKKGGELGFVNRGDLVPEFEAAAFALKENEVSGIVETKYGFHLIQLIDRRGEQINARHILIKPKVAAEDLQAAKGKADSIHNALKSGTLGFDEAARKFSDDAETRNNAGLMINPQTGNSKFEADQIDPSLFFSIDKMREGEISEPQLVNGADGSQSYKILMLKTRTSPHRANLKDDYQRLQSSALSYKQMKATEDWIAKKRKNTYIQISSEYGNCVDLKKWKTPEH